MGVFWSGDRASCNNGFTRGGSFPLCPLEKGNEVANLVDSFLMEKKTERPLSSQTSTESSLAKDLGVSLLAFSHLKSTATSWPEKVFKSPPYHTSNRPSPPGQGERRMNTFA